jgi:5,10-methylenetetrahydromethanopterin reductase
MEPHSMPTYGIAVFPQYSAGEYARLCQLVEDAGFQNIWVPDERFFRDLGVCLALAATHTRRVTIGSAVTDPYIRHPALTATLMATIDELSGGRLVMGIGAGISGFKALGVQQERPQLAIREAIELMRALWTGSPVDFTGQTTSFTSRLDFTPRRPDIPVWIAGRGPAVLQLAGEIADGVMIGGLASEPGLRYAFGRIDGGLRKAKRAATAITRSLWVHTAVAADGAQARDAVRNIVAGVLISSLPVLQEIGVPLPEDLVASLHGVTYGMNNPEMRGVAKNLTPEVLGHFSVAGDAGEVRARMAQLGAMGVDHMAIVPWLAEGQDLEAFVRALAAAVL